MSSSSSTYKKIPPFQGTKYAQLLSVSITFGVAISTGLHSWLTFIVTILGLIALSIFCITKKHYIDEEKAEPTEKIRKSWLIGTAGITVCGTLPQVVALFLDLQKSSILATCVLLCNFGSVVFLLSFLKSKREFEINEFPNPKNRVMVYGAYVVYITLKYNLLCIFAPHDKLYLQKVMLFTLFYVILFSGTAADFWVIYWRGVRVKTSLPTVVSSPQTLEVSQLSETVQFSPELQCNVCTTNYSTSVTPRMLVGCGHTICGGCVGKLQKNLVVVCPFCREPTNIPVRGLPKNFALMGMAQA